MKVHVRNGARFSRAIRLTSVCGVVLLMTTGCAWISRSSVPSDPHTGWVANDGASSPSISASGRFATFVVNRNERLSPEDTNDVADVYVRDNLTGATEPVSLTPTGGVSSAGSDSPWISDDGRFVAFRSAASDLVANDTDGVNDVFVRDRQTQTTTLVSVNDDETSIAAPVSSLAISGDGTTIAMCIVTITVPAQLCGPTEIRHRTAGTTTLLPHLRNATFAGGASLSYDGSVVAYREAGLQPSTVTLAIANSSTAVILDDLGIFPYEFLDAVVVDVKVSGDGSKYALTESRNHFSAPRFGTVTVGTVGTTTGRVVHRYDWTRSGQLNFDGSILAVTTLTAAGEVMAVDDGSTPLKVVSSNVSGGRPVAVSGETDLSADGKWVTFVTTENDALGFGGDSQSAVYTRSVAQRRDPPT